MADNWDKAISLAQGKFMILISDKILLKRALKYLHNFSQKFKCSMCHLGN